MLEIISVLASSVFVSSPLDSLAAGVVCPFAAAVDCFVFLVSFDFLVLLFELFSLR